MNCRDVGLFLVLWSVGATGLYGNAKCVQEATPVKLPLERYWRVALGCTGAEPEWRTGSSPRASIERAWRSYLDGDTLASRVELGKWLPDLLEHGNTADLVLALSVAKLAAAGSPTSGQAVATSLTDDLAQARPNWREEPSLGAWVDLLDGAAAARREATEAAERSWTAAAHARDAPLRVQGLAHLGLAYIAPGLESPSGSLAHLQAAERAFASAGDARGVAAALILRITAFSTAQDAAKADSGAAAAESYCRTQGLADGVVESLLAASDSAKAFGQREKAARLWARAEDAALRSGLMPVRVLSPGELVRLKQYTGGNLSLPKSREYSRWAAATGNILLIEKSSRATAAALKNNGQMGASGWYGVMADDAAASLAMLPARTRFLHAALIDYGLLEAGVDPAGRPELFVGRAYEAYCKDLIGALKRIGKFAKDEDLDDVNQMASELERLAKQADRHRESALGALRQSDRKRAAKEFSEFFRRLPLVMEKIDEVNQDVSENKKQAPDYTAEAKLTYAAGLLEAWSMRDPSRLRALAAELQETGRPVDVPLLLSAEESSNAGAGELTLQVEKSVTTGAGKVTLQHKGTLQDAPLVSSVAESSKTLVGYVNESRSESDSEALGAAVARGRPPKGRAWPRLVTRYAAAGGGSAVTAAAFGVDPEKLNEQEGAQFQIAYAGQFALAVNGEITHVQLGGERPFEWLLPKIRSDYSLRGDVEKASMFGLMIRVMQMAFLSTERGATRLANTKYFRSIMEEDLDMPDFDSLDDQDSKGNQETGDATTGESDTAPKGFRGFEFSVWSMQYPVLLNAAVRPGSPYLEETMSDAQADLAMSPSRAKALLPREVAQELRDIKNTKRAIVLDLALSALAGRRYRKGIEQLSKFERMIPLPTKLERVQVNYVKAMCYRGLGDAPREEALLKAAGVELEGLRRSVATRNASLRLRDLRQLIQEEYLSALYRRGDWTGMARAIAAYRLASVLPAAILAAAPRNPLAQELETLKDTYHALAAGAESSPVTRQSYRELFKLFERPERLPAGNPTLNAIEQATYLVTNELYAETPGGTRTGAVIRPAIPGELLILQSVGHTGVHTVTIDEHGHASGYYRYMPIASLEALCQDFEKALQAEGSSEAGTRLFDRLLAYLPEMKGKHRLSILADGPLQNLAWAALPIPDGHYLIEKYEIGILSGAKPAPGSGPAPAREQILAITDPDSDVDATGKLAAIGRAGVITLEGAGATLPNIQRELTRADAVYISTHGQSDYLRPDYSFLELTGGNRLYSLDLGHLDFSGRRLLLSACETRTGRTYGGEEAYGLADAFLARNASTVVATRWRVEAPAAAAFSVAFYESLLAGADYTAGATLAARSLLEGKKPDWRAPRHWAAYEPVTRFFDAGKKAAQFTTGSGSLDAAETARIMEVVRETRKRAQLERQELAEKEATLKADLIGWGERLTLEEDRNSVLSVQVSSGRKTEKWVGKALQTAKAALKENPQWKPAERVQVTVTVKDESGAAIPGAVVVAEEIGRRKRATQSTDGGGRAVFLDMRAATRYDIAVSAKGFVRAVSYRDDDDANDAGFADVEKIIVMRPVVEDSSSEPKSGLELRLEEEVKAERKAANKKSERKPQPVFARPAGPLRALLTEVNAIEASNDAIPARIVELEADRTDAHKTLESKSRDRETYLKQIDECRTKLEQESGELNALLRQVHLPDFQREPFEISGTVEDTAFKGVRAKVTLQRVGMGVEETTSSDESGHFVFVGAKSGVEYTVAAEAEGHTAWRSLPVTFYFPCSFFVRLRAPGDDVPYRRESW